MTAKEYRQATLAERKRHNQAIEKRNRERDIKRDDERRQRDIEYQERERRFRNNRLFSNALSAPQTASNVLRSILAYCLIIMLVVNIVRVSSDMTPLTVSSFFEVMSQCPDYDFGAARIVIDNFSWDNVPGALFNSFVLPFLRLAASSWNVIVFFFECIIDCFTFVWFLLSYFFGWYVPV